MASFLFSAEALRYASTSFFSVAVTFMLVPAEEAAGFFAAEEAAGFFAAEEAAGLELSVGGDVQGALGLADIVGGETVFRGLRQLLLGQRRRGARFLEPGGQGGHGRSLLLFG